MTTDVLSISLKQPKVKESTKNNLTRNSGLHFLDTPKGDDLKIYEMKLEDEFPIFESFSALIGYLLPEKIAYELFHVISSNSSNSFKFWIFQAIKLEIVVLVWIIFWMILAFCLPVGVIVSFCGSSNSQINDPLESSINIRRSRWTENSLTFLLHALLILMLGPIIINLAANEQISKVVNYSPNLSTDFYEDINTFIHTTHMQISLITTSSMDIATEAIRKDLEDIIIYLGVPYRVRVAEETTLDNALDNLATLKSEVAKVTQLASDLLMDINYSKSLELNFDDSIKGIGQQLISIQQQCATKDRPLCLAIQFSNYDDNNKISPFEKISEDPKILYFSFLQKDEIFNLSITMANSSYSSIPVELVQEFSPYITDIKSILNRKRTELYKSTYELDSLARTLFQKITTSQKAIFAFLEDIVVKWDLWRWLVILVTTVLVVVIWILLICGVPCGCGNTPKANTFFIFALCLSSFISLALWLIGSIVLVVGGHGHVILCKTLYQHPHYTLLETLLDSKSAWYSGDGLLFEDFAKENDTLRVAEVLKGCQRDQTSYKTFHLKNKLDIDKMLNGKNWNDLKQLFEKFMVAPFSVYILPPNLQLNLQMLSLNTAANFSNYRQEMSNNKAKGKNLDSFADQLNNMARQIQDSVVARRLDNLAFSVRNIVGNEIQRLNDLRAKILYKITKLEVLLPSLNKQINQSLFHLKSIQFFLDNDGGDKVLEMVKREFVERIEDYLDEMYNFTSMKVEKEIGKCRPLWEIFHAGRFYACKSIVNALNAIAFANYSLILILIIITPVTIKLAEFLKAGYHTDESPATILPRHHHVSPHGLLHQEEETLLWISPPSNSPGETREISNNTRTGWSTNPPTSSLRVSEVANTPRRIPRPPPISYRKVSPSKRFKFESSSDPVRF